MVAAAERWLWVRWMVAAEVVVGERDGGGNGSGVGEMREMGENIYIYIYIFFFFGG
jgi:hypothetical protein